mgnify:CR=1 FL=1
MSIPVKIALRLNGRLIKNLCIIFDPKDTSDMSALYTVIVERANTILSEALDTNYYSHWVISNGDFDYSDRDATSVLTANSLISLNLYSSNR